MNYPKTDSVGAVVGNGKIRTLWSTAIWVSLGAIYLTSRTFGLNQSMWEDELYTADVYIGHGLARVFDADRYVANNHPLYSIMGNGVTAVVGNSEVPLRLISVIPATAAAAGMTYWLLRRYGRAAGLVFAFLVTFSPMHFEEFRQARGWGLVILGAALVLVASLEMQRTETIRWHHATFFVAGALIGIWTVYAVALPFAVHGLILLATRPERKLLSVMAGLVAIGSVVFYWPLRSVINDPVALRGQGGEAESVRDGFVTFGNLIIDPLNRLATPLFDLALPTVMAVLVAGGLVLGGAVFLLRAGHWTRLLHLFLPVGVVFVYLAAREAGIWDRYVSFLLPHVLILAALGGSMVWSLTPKPLARVGIASVLSLLGLGIAIGFAQYATPIVSVPRENFKGAAEVIDGAAPVEAAYTHMVFREFDYSLEKVKLERLPVEEFVERSCNQDGPAVFVDYQRRLPATNTACLEARGVRIVLPQRQDPPISIWLIP